MFGYIKPVKCELKVREYEEFKRYYCGVCRSLKKYSIVPRLLLTYEAASLALLLDSLKKTKPEKARSFCVFAMKRIDFYRSKEIDNTARIFVALLHEKMRDNYLDKRNLFYLLIMSLLKGNPEISELFREFYDLEKTKSNFEILAEKQGQIMGKILIATVHDENNKKILYYLGLNLGKWLYVIDALDDFEKDKRKKTFNPLVEESKGNLEEARKVAKIYLENHIDEIWKAYDLLEIKKNKPILDNIVYLGIPLTTKRILEKNACNCGINHSINL
ncbi:DUF5685 family protein [Thermotoga sp. KOL6]|uniref:DUF5685 family protein n=1 Tax=Thermotoga sp. KOL6 TaxID=126741 RepID=UPI000C7673E7|nr:DUF5685 family protein [Thermotoga sp. KOL6]PLV58078.1 hypothetical protein AS005_08715 [Thermotoga sp. KOL6]